MSAAAHGVREEKLKWLLRPVEWASTLSFLGAASGFVYWYYGIYSAETVVIALCVALGVNAALLLWAVARVTNIVRRAF